MVGLLQEKLLAISEPITDVESGKHYVRMATSCTNTLYVTESLEKLHKASKSLVSGTL